MTSSLSLLAQYDDLRRCLSILTDGVAEEEFLKFVNGQEECRRQWLKAVHEARRLQNELDEVQKTRSDLETKLYHARKLLETESKARREAELEKNALEKRLNIVFDIVKNDRDVKDETRNKLESMNALAGKNKNKRKSVHSILGNGNDINSTGSFLSDLSLTQSEDDFLETDYWKEFVPNNPENQNIIPVVGKKMRLSVDGKRISSGRRSVNKSLNKSKNRIIDLGPNDKIVAHTKVTVPQDDGPITAESIIQAVPKINNTNKINHLDIENFSPNKFKTPVKSKSPYAKKNMFTPTAPPPASFEDYMRTDEPQHQSNVMREHVFMSKTYLKIDNCVNCQKKIKFGSVGLKCRECRICIHPDCKDKYLIGCVPQSATKAATNGILGFIHDYAPSVGPMIPALIVHCVNEIETRGLKEVGIFRVSGSEREVKMLKERFLRGKGVPFLNNIDIHVLCGCIKDFLRSLKEPLIPLSLWAIFSNAVQHEDTDEKKKHIYNAIRRLPQANRDTLAFLILHLQRIAQCPETKMPLINLAKIFGPTIVGYSCAEPEGAQLFTDTPVQFNVMQALLNIPTEFWNQFLTTALKQSPPENDANDFEKTVKNLMSTPVFRSARKDRKYYNTPPYPTSNKKK